MYFHHPDLLQYYGGDEAGEPSDPPRFLVSDLPEHLRLKLIERGEIWPRRQDPFAALLDAGVDELEWRQPLCHLERDLVADDVFGALQELLPDDIRSSLVISLRGPGARPRRYHKIEWSAGWPLRDGDAVATKRDGFVVRELCRPALDDSEPSIVRALASAPDDVELAFPSWMDRDDRILCMNHPVVTEGLVERWRATSISRHLREDNAERDLWFVESAGGYKKRGRPAAYRWVDVPTPDWVDPS